MTYDASEPTQRDRVRRMVGDTAGGSNEDLADETYDAILTTHTEDVDAALVAIRAIIAKRARLPQSKSVVGVSASRRSLSELEKVERWLLSEQAAGAEVYAGGVYQDDHDTMAEDTSLIQPRFTENMHRDE